jgi:hypothetical protein
MSCICRFFFCYYLQCVDCSVAVFEALDVFVADDLQALQIDLCLCFALFSATILQCECVNFADVFEGGFF